MWRNRSNVLAIQQLLVTSSTKLFVISGSNALSELSEFFWDTDLAVSLNDVCRRRRKQIAFLVWSLRMTPLHPMGFPDG